MTTPLGSYSFLPWLRQGIANKVTTEEGDSQVKLRASIPVNIEISGDGLTGGPITQSVPKTVQLFGPGDVIGIDSRAIVRVDPRNWITNFEPNYLAGIEFYDEDFPWRYTPAVPKQSRLRPWLTLVVLEEGEFQEGTDQTGRPLPYFTLSDRSLLPPADQLWAWVHVHVNRGLTAAETEITSTDMTAVIPRLSATLGENPDLGYSRILCPRKLKENTPYHAFLVPVFESGRLAGLGLDPATAPHATHGAWQDYPQNPADRLQPDNYPIYFRWYFRTGAIGDFESLVRLLEPRPADARVGWRDIDVQDPGSNLPGITDPALGGVLKLSGALRVPLAGLNQEDRAKVEQYDRWATPYPHPFQTALAGFINLADDYGSAPAAQANAAARAAAPPPAGGNVAPVDPDPLITPPLYGRWHALTDRLLSALDGSPLPNRTNWVHALNLDPRYRAVAGFGTDVIQQGQEEYMNLAWAQIGDVLEAIRRIRAAQLAREVSVIWYERHLKTLYRVAAERGLMLTAPLQKRVMLAGKTAHYQLAASRLSTAATSGAMRRAVRPGGRLIRRLPFTASVRPDALLSRMNHGLVAAAPPKATPAGVTTVEASGHTLLPPGVPAFLVDWLRRWPWLPTAVLVVGLIVALLLGVLVPIPLGLVLAAVVAAIAAGAARLLARWKADVARADRLDGAAQTPQSVDRLPVSAGFVLRAPVPGAPPPPPPPTGGSTDSPEAVRFKAALKNSYTLLEQSTQASVETPPVTLDLQVMGQTTLAAIDPDRTIVRRVYDGIVIPGHIADLQVEEFKEPLYYPEINLPMYQPLYQLSPELFVPNINLVPENSVTLLETNRKVIESYMVGLNHEFGRELLWREYPSDNRGSYFRQFWDVSAFLAPSAASDAAAREKLKDIPPLHLWSKFSQLGTHDNRGGRAPGQEDTVLVIRGELLKRYPNAVIYAQRAAWPMKGNTIDTSQPRSLVQLTGAEVDAPPREKLRTPLYAAKLEPDIYFLGFDLTIEQARGGTGEHAGDDPGWFFIIKERPGEPRFGLDLSRDGSLNVWNDLSWTDVAPTGNYLRIDPAAPPALTEPPSTAGTAVHDQWAEDHAVTWDAGVTSSDLAYIFFQAPVLVAIHAAELLRPQ